MINFSLVVKVGMPTDGQVQFQAKVRQKVEAVCSIITMGKSFLVCRVAAAYKNSEVIHFLSEGTHNFLMRTYVVS